MMMSVRRRDVVAAAVLVLGAACGGGSDYNPTGPSGGGGGGGQSGATVTIGNGGVTPASVTINVGQTVTFTNSSSQRRNISSDPHPVHNNCPAINSVNLISAGQTKQTAAFTTAGTCGYHDHDDPDNGAVQGTIVVR